MILSQAWKDTVEKRNQDRGPVSMHVGSVVSIAKVLLQELAPTKALKEVSTGTNARAWFKELLAERKLWDKEWRKFWLTQQKQEQN